MDIYIYMIFISYFPYLLFLTSAEIDISVNRDSCLRQDFLCCCFVDIKDINFQNLNITSMKLPVYRIFTSNLSAMNRKYQKLG